MEQVVGQPLPPGVNEVGGGTETVPNTPPAQQHQYQPPIQEEVINQPWNWLQVGAGVVVVVSFLMAVHYWSYKIKEVNPELKKQGAKIASMDAKINSSYQQ